MDQPPVSPQRIRKVSGRLSNVAAAFSAEEMVPLAEALQLGRLSRSAFYRDTALPKIKQGGRVFTTRAALEASARRRGVEL